MIQDDSVEAFKAAIDRSMANFDRLSPTEKIEALKDAGILDENGNLAPRYSNDWDGDEEPISNAAK